MKLIEKQIFFELLHKARDLRDKGWRRLERKAYLMGMMWHWNLHRKDLEIAENMKDFWCCENSGAG